MNSPESPRLPAYASFVRPATGAWQRLFLNLLLRILVKWTAGLGIDIPRLRARQAALDRRARPGAGVTRNPVDCDGVAAEWLRPRPCDDSRVLLYLHGGAFIARSPETHAAMLASWCSHLEAVALMVDYRLAPEHPYPAALDDCHEAYRWLLRQGHDPRQIVISGDSAGGNLVLALLQRLRSAGEAMPACAVLLSPFLDFTLSGTSAVSNARRDPVFTPAFALAIRACYAPPERFLDGSVSPLYGNFHGLPPMLFQVGSTEMLLDDAVRAAARAHDSGVPVSLEIWDRLPHVFQALPVLPQAHEAVGNIIRFIRQHAGWNVAWRQMAGKPGQPTSGARARGNA